MQGTAKARYHLRGEKNAGLNYMLAYLGIEKDDESDEDFVVDEDGEEGCDSSEESGV
ncbi:hypothetical protein PC111_g15931 [Phytophthora cactorum]|nr:hypothetical protein PC111_g15931 [Phytophthora cactorum]